MHWFYNVNKIYALKCAYTKSQILLNALMKAHLSRSIVVFSFELSCLVLYIRLESRFSPNFSSKKASSTPKGHCFKHDYVRI